jgi:alkyl hydroperoxide reductase subunit D
MKNIEFKDYAKDIKLNLGSVLKTDPESGLTQNQIYAIALASSYATKNQVLIDAILEIAAENLSAEETNAAKASATLMAMTNIYYRFTHLVSDKEYGSLPAKLRMNVMANPGVDKIDFEFYSLAVSSINGCGLCMDSHTKKVTNAGVDKVTIQHIIRIAAVINAAAQAIFIN